MFKFIIYLNLLIYIYILVHTHRTPFPVELDKKMQRAKQPPFWREPLDLVNSLKVKEVANKIHLKDNLVGIHHNKLFENRPKTCFSIVYMSINY